MQVISLLVSGLYRKEMADVLNVSESTVNTHLNRVYSQTRPMRRALLSSWAVLNGFDHHGNWNGIYLFDGKTGVPWDREPGTERSVLTDGGSI